MPSATGRAWDRESSPVKDRRSTTVPRDDKHGCTRHRPAVALCDFQLSVAASTRVADVTFTLMNDADHPLIDVPERAD